MSEGPEINLTKRPVDNIIYLPLTKIPEISEDLLKFLETQIVNTFPNLIGEDKERLIHHQGKLDLIAELRYIYERQQSPGFDEDSGSNSFSS